jgi:hypothetical protein
MGLRPPTPAEQQEREAAQRLNNDESSRRLFYEGMGIGAQPGAATRGAERVQMPGSNQGQNQQVVDRQPGTRGDGPIMKDPNSGDAHLHMTDPYPKQTDKPR